MKPALEDWVRESRRAQDLELHIQDPAVLHRVAVLLLTTTEPALADSDANAHPTPKGRQRHDADST